ncbi:hypothetical protein [Caldimonas tepidiphila]|uniref:hypothetical protein n=1 Tax=Caldimonas tepidiphila TaxID=2315841 RepID=UPI0013009166|nr:hypothetical protein [Caldimonas tepidiphila]
MKTASKRVAAAKKWRLSRHRIDYIAVRVNRRTAVATAKQKPSGKWEIAVRHPSLPRGRKYFTFDTEAEANAYAHQWT